MDFKNSTISDYNIGDVWLKKDGHKMEVFNKTDTSIEMKLFVHKSSDNFKSGNFTNKKYFLQYFNFEDKVASKWSIFEGYKKQK